MLFRLAVVLLSPIRYFARLNLLPSHLHHIADMLALAAIAGILIIFLVLLDAFETIVLPRRVQRSYRLTAWFYRNFWTAWTKLSRSMPGRLRENFLGYFGPLSLIFLLVLWAISLIFGFTLLQYGLGEHLRLSDEQITFGVLLYHSGETFFTLGYGDITPISGVARTLAVLEAGMGFAFLGVVVGYLPVVYSSFSSREIQISMLDSRAGSPPTAAELLTRLGCCPDQTVLDEVFRDWERWSADLLSSHISYPVLCFFRSQHGNQSWLGALTVILDVTSLVVTGVDGIRTEQAKLTFAMARHAAVDLAQVVAAQYDPLAATRLSEEELLQLRKSLASAGVRVKQDETADAKLEKLRSLYEPYVEALSRRLLFKLPPWMHSEKKKDNWQSGPWDRAIQAKGLSTPARVVLDDHF